MKTLDLIKTELKKEYPSGVVSNLRQMNNPLYIKLRDYAKENDTSIKEVLEKNDFIYLRKSIIRMYVEDFIELEKLYPDYKVESFYEKNSKLYYRVLSHSKSMKTSLKNYLNSLGFEYVAREDISDNSVTSELSKLYPNKKVEKLSAKNSKLYYRIYQLAKKEHMEMNEYIKKLGFEVVEAKSDEKKTSTKKETSKKEASPKKEKATKTTKKTTKVVESKKKDASLKKTTQKTTTKRGRKPKTVELTTTIERVAEA